MNLLALADIIKTGSLKRRIDWNDNLPKHVAIMMDGNGRWGTRRGLPRTAGHYAGMLAMKETIRNCRAMNIKHLTLYAFSTENWKRPRQEVDYIIGLVDEFVNDPLIGEMNRNGIKIHFIGDIRRFPERTRQLMAKAAALTESNGGMIVNFAVNYGGRSEIIHAVKSYIADKEANELSEENFEKYLYTANNPSPELIIRTSGEKRLSGFLLWQSASAEIWFTDKLWPDFNKQLLYQAILDYQRRKKNA